MRSLIVFIIALITSPLYGQAKAVITGPETGTTGDLIVLSSEDSEGSKMKVVHWDLVNSNKTCIQFDGKVVFSSGEPGDYIFLLTVADYDAEFEEVTLDTTKHTVTLKGLLPQPNPNPGPEPGPDPNPGPDPTPVNPEPNLAGIAKECFDAMKSVDTKPGEALKLARNLETVAGKSAGLSWSVRQMNQELMRLNTDFSSADAKARWKSWLDCFQDTMGDRTDRLGAAEGMIEHAKGLKAFDAWKPSTSVMKNSPKKATLTDTVKEIRSGLNNLKEEIGN